MNQNSHTVLILGARGRFGSAAVQAFAAAGWTVLAQRRSPGAPQSATAHPSIRWIDVDVQDTEALQVQARAASVVVHAMNPVYTATAWRRDAPDHMRAAIAISRALGAFLMFPGNVYNFGHGMPAVLREDTPQDSGDGTSKGAVRVQVEAMLRDAARDHGLHSAVIRAGDFFGSGTGSLFDKVLVTKLAKGRMVYPAGLDIPTAWAYLPDLARTFVRVAQQRDAVQGAQSYHFHGLQLTGKDWLEALTLAAREQGWIAGDATLRHAGMPWPLIRAVGLVMPTMASLAETRYVWNTPHALDNSRLLALIGTEPHTPLEQAARQALADLGLIAPVRSGLRAATS